MASGQPAQTSEGMKNIFLIPSVDTDSPAGFPQSGPIGCTACPDFPNLLSKPSCWPQSPRLTRSLPVWHRQFAKGQSGFAPMGTFGTAEEALQNVAAFRAASAAKPPKKKDKARNSKAAKDSKAKKRKSHKRKEHSSKSDGKRSHKRARVSSDDDSSSSASDAEVTPTMQLERGRRAAHSLRHLLHYFPAVRQDLREANSLAISLLRQDEASRFGSCVQITLLKAGYSTVFSY